MPTPKTKRPKAGKHPPAVIRLDPELRGALESYAAKFHLSLSGAVRSLLVRALEAEAK